MVNKQTAKKVSDVVKRELGEYSDELTALLMMRCLEEGELVNPMTIKRIILVSICHLLTDGKIMLKRKANHDNGRDSNSEE